MSTKNKFLRAFLLTLSLVLAGGCVAPASPPTAIPPVDTAPPPSAAARIPSPTSLPGPAIQAWGGLVYDAESERVILAPGWASYGPTSGKLEAVWTFDLETKSWQRMPETAERPITVGSAIAYDNQSDQVIMFLGCGLTIKPAIRETWAYDYNTNTWANMKPEGGPFGLIGARMVYDAESDRVILHGGLDVSKEPWVSSVDTWAYDYESNTWTKMAPAGDPPKEDRLDNYFAMSYDAAADRVIAWKCDIATPPDKIWVYDYNTDTWEERQTKTYPEQCLFNTLLYDPATGLNILFGGFTLPGVINENAPPSNSTWGYDYATNTWKDLAAQNPPGPRGSHAMAYDAKTGQMVLFGGGNVIKQQFTNETWLYNPAANEWSMVPAGP